MRRAVRMQLTMTAALRRCEPDGARMSPNTASRCCAGKSQQRRDRPQRTKSIPAERSCRVAAHRSRGRAETAANRSPSRCGKFARQRNHGHRSMPRRSLSARVAADDGWHCKRQAPRRLGAGVKRRACSGPAGRREPERSRPSLAQAGDRQARQFALIAGECRSRRSPGGAQPRHASARDRDHRRSDALDHALAFSVSAKKNCSAPAGPLIEAVAVRQHGIAAPQRPRPARVAGVPTVWP